MSSLKQATKGAPKNIVNYQARQDKIERIKQVLRLHDSGMSKGHIAQKMGLTRNTVNDYIKDRSMAEDTLLKPPPGIRACLRCRCNFRPSSFGRFMCDQCNAFAKEAML